MFKWLTDNWRIDLIEKRLNDLDGGQHQTNDLSLDALRMARSHDSCFQDLYRTVANMQNEIDQLKCEHPIEKREVIEEVHGSLGIGTMKYARCTWCGKKFDDIGISDEISILNQKIGSLKAKRDELQGEE